LINNQNHEAKQLEGSQERIEELSARQLLNPDAGAHLHHTQNSHKD